MLYYYLVITLSFVKFCSSNGEIVTYVVPENCSEREFYVPSIMSCTPCDNHQQASVDRK